MVNKTHHEYQKRNVLKDKKFTKFSVSGKELEKSCLFSLCNEYYKETDDYFKRLGFTYGGPLCLAFIEWFYPLLKENKFSDVLFISRDGWILKKVFDILYPGSKIKPHYVYASRQICQNVDLQEYKKYLEEQNIIGKKIALVDTITENYTAPKFLQKFFKEKITGFYFRIAKENSDFFSCEFEEDIKIYNWGFIEFLITAPEYPAFNIKNNQIIFEENNEFENIRKDIYLKISEGICTFITKFKKINKNELLKFNNDFVISWVNFLWLNLTKEDMTFLSSVYYTSNHNSKIYSPLITRKFYLLCNLLCCFPFFSLRVNFYTFEIVAFGKISIFKRVIRLVSKTKTFYFLGIPFFCKKIK